MLFPHVTFFKALFLLQKHLEFMKATTRLAKNLLQAILCPSY